MNPKLSVAPVLGAVQREFWKRAEDRNHETAVLYDILGMAEYEAIEVFAKRNPENIY